MDTGDALDSSGQGQSKYQLMVMFFRWLWWWSSLEKMIEERKGSQWRDSQSKGHRQRAIAQHLYSDRFPMRGEGSCNHLNGKSAHNSAYK